MHKTCTFQPLNFSVLWVVHHHRAKIPICLGGDQITRLCCPFDTSPNTIWTGFQRLDPPRRWHWPCVRILKRLRLMFEVNWQIRSTRVKCVDNSLRIAQRPSSAITSLDRAYWH